MKAKIKYMIFMFTNILIKFTKLFKKFHTFYEINSVLKCINMSFKNNNITDFITDYIVCR